MQPFSTGDSLPLILNTIKEITNYYHLGIQLGIEPHELERIEINHGKDLERCKSEVMVFWIRNDPEPTWSKLAIAVEQLGRHANVARKLQEHEVVGDAGGSRWYNRYIALLIGLPQYPVLMACRH